ncbi:Ycf49-like protein [Bienertia sinuspersici]
MLSLASPLYSSNLPLLFSSSTSTTSFSCPPQHPLRLPAVYCSIQTRNTANHCTGKNQKWILPLLSAGVAMALVGPTIAAESPPLLYSIELHEPSNALSLPTWAVHVSSVAEWIIAMALVWQYGDKPGNESWKGLSWGMVPLLGGAMCACTWHFFYNAESLEVLVALQAALTFIGNVTICIAAFRIYKSQSSSENI